MPALHLYLYLLWSAVGGCGFPLSVEELDEDMTPSDDYVETTETKVTTESWNFNEYTSAGYRDQPSTAIVENELQALRKVAQILLLLGEQVIPRILGDPPIDRCDQKNDDLNVHKKVFMWKAKEYNNL